MTTEAVRCRGASGFVVAALTREYHACGARVIGVDIQGDGQQVCAGDAANPEAWGHLLDQAPAVVHTAALVTNAIWMEE